MSFKRKIGEEFDWYAVDSTGSIALFASGFAVAPKAVFVDESKYLAVKIYFDNLPVSTNAHLSQGMKARKISH